MVVPFWLHCMAPLLHSLTIRQSFCGNRNDRNMQSSYMFRCGSGSVSSPPIRDARRDYGAPRFLFLSTNRIACLWRTKNNRITATIFLVLESSGELHLEGTFRTFIRIRSPSNCRLRIRLLILWVASVWKGNAPRDDDPVHGFNMFWWYFLGSIERIVSVCEYWLRKQELGFTLYFAASATRREENSEVEYKSALMVHGSCGSHNAFSFPTVLRTGIAFWIRRKSGRTRHFDTSKPRSSLTLFTQRERPIAQSDNEIV